MKYLEDKPRPGYFFVYAITESIYDIEEFFRILLEELYKSKSISEPLQKKTKKYLE